MPVPSASSKIVFITFNFFWACLIFFEHSQIFWSWTKARNYLINLHIWAWPKIFEHIQKILNRVKNISTWSKNIWTSRWIRHEFTEWKPSFGLAHKVWTGTKCKSIFVPAQNILGPVLSRKFVWICHRVENSRLCYYKGFF